MTSAEIDQLPKTLKVGNEEFTLGFLDRQTGEVFTAEQLPKHSFNMHGHLKWLDVIYIREMYNA